MKAREVYLLKLKNDRLILEFYPKKQSKIKKELEKAKVPFLKNKK